jgi:hypothetical protein
MIELSPTFSSKVQAMLRALAVLAVGLVAGCQSTMQVRHQDAMGAEPQAYGSYRVVEHPVGRTGTVDDVIEEVIHRGMLAKGYSHAPATEADLLLSYKVLLSGDATALGGPAGPPDDGLNGEASYSNAQPVWDLVAGDELAGPQLGETGALWPSPGPTPVFDTIPSIDVSGVSKQTQSKTLMVMLQEPTTMRVLWLGWSTANVKPEQFAATTRAAIGEIISRVPGALAPTALD